MEVVVQKNLRGRKQPIDKSPGIKLPAISSLKHPSAKNLSWLKSLKKPNLQNSLPSNVALPSNTITKTKAHHIKLGLEDLDQENRRLLQALNYVKTCNKELAGIMEEERGRLFDSLQQFEGLINSQEHLKPHGALRREGLKTLASESTPNRKPRPAPHDRLQSRYKVLSTSKNDKRYRSHSNLDGASSQQPSAREREKSLNSTSKGRPKLRLELPQPPAQNFTELLELARDNKDRFKPKINELLTAKLPDPINRTDLMLAISALNIHLSDLERQVSRLKSCVRYGEFVEQMVFARELQYELTRIRHIHHQLLTETEEHLQGLRADNEDLEGGIFALEEQLAQITEPIARQEEILARHKAQINSRKDTLEQLRSQNGELRAELESIEDQIWRLKEDQNSSY